MVAPLVRDVKPAERGAEDAVMIELALEQHGAHAGLYGLALPGRDGEAVDRAGDVRVAGHVAARAVLPHQARRQAAAQEAGLTYVSVSDQATALMEVSSGTSDACIVDLLMAGAMIGEGTSYPDLTYTVRLTEEDYGVGCRKGSDLTDFINEQLKVLYDDGTIAELAEQYGISDNIVPQE